MTGQLGVHQEHCCQVHGCKYGDEDCPVAKGNIIGGKYCELCADEQMMQDNPKNHYWAPKVHYKEIEPDEVDINIDAESIKIWNELASQSCYISIATMHQGRRCCKVEAGIPYMFMSYTENKLAFGLTFNEVLQEVKEWSKKIIDQTEPRV